jgi:shikimate kinase
MASVLQYLKGCSMEKITPGPNQFPPNLILIGMFGSGKSTVGRILASKLRYHFVDVDQLIEGQYRMPLQKILDKLGMKKFMQLEDKTLQDLQYRHCVISPGGSTVYYPQAMKHLKSLGPRIYLRISLAALKERLPDWSNRGVVCRGGNTLSALFKERQPLFKKYADMTVDSAGKSAEKIANEILKKLKEAPFLS